ncbi:MAG: hypothetical protein ACOXZP_03400 [Minisyncoccales bacterium]|jgi:hypothetical protein
MESKVFKRNVIALELIYSLRSKVLFLERNAREPILYFYKTEEYPLKNKRGKVIVYYE